MKKNSPILLVGGGTGGHIYPLVAIGEELEAAGRPFIFVGGKAGREKLVAEELGWEYRSVSAGKWRRYLSFKSIGENLIDVTRLASGFFESLSLISSTGAEVVFSKGGYVALPVVAAAWVLRRKIIIHESDSVMGLTNRVSARFARQILTAFDPSVFPNRDKRFHQIGVPIRKSLRQAATLRPPKKARPLILVIGGSQGSSAINRLIRDNLAALIKIADIVHITGEAEALMHKKLTERLERKNKNAYKAFAFITRELPYYYQLADLIISRSGITTIAEASLFSKAMYLIPLPSAAGDHQLVNAKHLQASGAVVYRDERNLTNDQFTSDVFQLLSDKNQLQGLGKKLQEYFNEADATMQVIKIISKEDN